MVIQVLSKERTAELLRSHKKRRPERIESNMGRLVEAFKKDEADGSQNHLEETLKQIEKETKASLVAQEPLSEI